MTEPSRPNTHAARRFVRAVARTLPGAATRTIVLSVATGLTEGAGALLLVPLLATIGLDVSNGGVGRLASGVHSALAAVRVAPSLGSVLALYVLVVSAQAFLTRAQLMASLTLEHQFVAALRRSLFDAFAHAHWTFQRSNRPSDVTHVVIHELDRVGVATYQGLYAASNAILVLVYIAIAARVSAPMTALVAAAAAVVMLSLRGRVGRSSAGGEAVSSRTRRLYADTTAYLGAARLVKSLGFETREAAALANTAADLAAAQGAAGRLYAGSQTAIQIGAVLALTTLLYAGLEWLQVGPAGVVLLLYIFARLMPRLSALQQSMQHIAHYLPSFDAVDSLLARAGAARDSGDDSPTPPGLTRELRLDEVTYTHPGNAVPAVDRLTLTIPAGGFIAVVGASGSGKSTLADLVCGLLEPDLGALSADDVRLDPPRTQAWRRTVGYVEQEAFLFHDTIRANLTWTCPEATEPELREALELASAAFVWSLPDGLDTTVGERGTMLSGGERQRLALARALLRRPRLLVLDEPTSALDAGNEARVLEAIEQLAGRVTIILMTHRLQAVRRADTICVLESGRLVEIGDWGTLGSRTAGRFRALCDAQGIDVAGVATRDVAAN